MPPPIPQQQGQQQFHPMPPQQQQQQQQQQQPPTSNQSHLTLRVILTRDETNYLFGFDGVLLEQLRQQTGASLVLTEPHYEQVLTIQGTFEIIFKAFSLVCRKLWDFVSTLPPPSGSNGQQRPLVLKLAVPATQCGPIIGKQGAKVREMRDLTGANIQVSQEGLPESTERCVEISGTGEACLQCTYHICSVMQEAPLRSEVVPYIPARVGGRADGRMPPGAADDGWKPVFLCGDKAYVITEGGLAAPAPPELLRRELAKTPLGDMAESLATLSVNNFGRGQAPAQATSGINSQPDYMNPLALIQAISSAQRQNVAVVDTAGGGAGQSQQTSREMSVPHDMVRVIIGKGGGKINEIRRISGAQVHVPAEEELSADERRRPDRVLTISGSHESILLAQFLVQSNMDMAVREREERRSPDMMVSNGGGMEPRRFHNDPRRRDSSGGGGGAQFRR